MQSAGRQASAGEWAKRGHDRAPHTPAQLCPSHLRNIYALAACRQPSAAPCRRGAAEAPPALLLLLLLLPVSLGELCEQLDEGSEVLVPLDKRLRCQRLAGRYADLALQRRAGVKQETQDGVVCQMGTGARWMLANGPC